MNENNDGETVTSPQQQMQAMQKLMETQMQMMQMQMQQQQQQQQQQNGNPNDTTATPVAVVKNVKVPEGHLDMNPNEFRTYSKDCRDYKKLTQYSDAQIVLQIRMNMDSDLKRAVDVNFKEAWDGYTVELAIEKIGTLLKSKNTPVVYRKEFDGLTQLQGEDIKTFIKSMCSRLRFRVSTR